MPQCQTLSTSFTFSHTELFTECQLSESGWICSGLVVLSLPEVVDQKHVPKTLHAGAIGPFFLPQPLLFRGRN